MAAPSVASAPRTEGNIRDTLMRFQSTVADYIDVSDWGWSLNGSRPCQQVDYWDSSEATDAPPAPAWPYVLCTSGQLYGLNMTNALSGKLNRDLPYACVWCLSSAQHEHQLALDAFGEPQDTALL